MVLPNFSFGSYYRANRFYAGFSIMDILGQSIQDKLYTNTANDLTINTVSHYFLNAGYLLDLTQDVRFQPSILLKYVAGAPLEVDLNTVFSFYDLLYLGASYRSKASVDFLFQINVSKQLSLCYSYEYPTNELSSFTKGSHEVALRYQFDFSKGKILSPRFF